MFKLPIKSLVRPTITQLYGNTSFNAWYASQGIKSPYHNGVDIGIGTSRETYGTPVVCPFKEAEVYNVIFDNPISTKGNGVYIQAIEGQIMYRMIAWHTGEIAVKVGDKIKEGDIICYIGNSGLCGSIQPDGTVKNADLSKDPWAGAHLHLMLSVYIKDALGNWNILEENNGVNGWIDPLRYFDSTKWYIGEEENKYKHDLPPFTQIMKGMGIVEALKFILKYFTIKR